MSIKNFSPQGETTTPFNSKTNAVNQMQLQHFDFICGQVMKENRILKYVVIVSCLAFFVSIGITLYAVSLPESIPVHVTMNDFGETHYIGAVFPKERSELQRSRACRSVSGKEIRKPRLYTFN